MTNDKLQILILILLGALLFPLISLAAGLVPCGGPGEPACEFCHFFVLLDNIIDFFLLKIVLPVATLLLVVGGGMFFLYAEDPKKVEEAKSLLTSVVIGLILIFAAFLIVGTFLRFIGVANWTEDIYRNWWQEGFFEIPCP